MRSLSTAEWTSVESLPELTVVVPTHDVEPWVDDCLTSIRSQQGVALRIIVVDDHSTDGTLSVVRRHAAEDSRLTVIEARERGGGPARNLGASLVTTEYMAFADGDDLLPPGAYAALAGSLAKTGSELAIGNFYKFSALRSWRPSLRWHVFDDTRTSIRLVDNPGLVWNRACWNRVFRTDFWQARGIEFPDVPRSNDIVPMTTALVTARAIDVIPDFVYLYRERPGTGSMTALAATVTGLLSYLRQEVECADLLADQPQQVQDQYQRVVFDADGWVHLRRALLQVHAEGGTAPAEIVELVRRLVAIANADYLARIPLTRRIVLRLVTAGRLPEAIECLVRLETDWTGPGAAGDARFWIGMSDLAFEDRDEHAVAIVDLVLEPLSRIAALAHDDVLEVIIAMLKGGVLDGIDGIVAAEGRPALRRVIAAITAVDTAGLRRASRLGSHQSVVLERASVKRGHLYLEGTARLERTEAELPLIARRMHTSGEAAVGALTVTATADGEVAWKIRVPGRRLVDGNWQLVARVMADDFGPVEVHVVAGPRGPVVPESRWARLVVLPRKQAGDRVVLAARGTFTRRVVRKVRTVVRRSA